MDACQNDWWLTCSVCPSKVRFFQRENCRAFLEYAMQSNARAFLEYAVENNAYVGCDLIDYIVFGLNGYLDTCRLRIWGHGLRCGIQVLVFVKDSLLNELLRISLGFFLNWVVANDYYVASGSARSLLKQSS